METGRVFKTYKEAMKAVLPNKETVKRIVENIKDHTIFKLENNETTGKPLSERTIDRKISRGAPTPFIKLVEGGGLSRQIKTKAVTAEGKVGYFSENHEKFKPGDPTIKVCDLVKIHHEGIGVPEHQFLTIDDKVEDIIEIEIRDRILGR